MLYAVERSSILVGIVSYEHKLFLGENENIFFFGNYNLTGGKGVLRRIMHHECYEYKCWADWMILFYVLHVLLSFSFYTEFFKRNGIGINL